MNMDAKTIARTIILDGNPEIPASVTDEENLFDKGWLDSFTIVTLVVEIEEKCGIALEEADLTEQNLCCISAIAEMITSYSPKV